MTTPPSWFERHPRKTLLGLVTASLILGLAAAEYALERGLRKPAPARHIRLMEYPPLMDLTVIGNRAKLEKRYRLEIDGLEEKPYRFRTDEDGFIQPSRVHADPQLTLVFLGGSTTECYWVDEASRFPSRAGQLLGERLGKRVNSLNAGISGSNTLHMIDILLNKLIPLRPDVAVMMENVNDVNIMLFIGSYWNRHRTRSLLVVEDESQGRFGRLGGSLVDAFFPGIAHRLSETGLFKRNTDEFAGLRNVQRGRSEVDDRQYAANLVTFAETCRSRGILPVLMTQFNRLGAVPDEVTARNIRSMQEWGIGYADYKGHLDRFNEIARRVARERGIPLVDLEARVPKDRRYIYDVVHLNTAGSELVSGIIAEELATNAEFQKRAGSVPGAPSASGED